MLRTEKFARYFTTPAKDVIAITSVAYTNGEMGWKTVHYPVAGITRIVEQLLSIDMKIEEVERSLESRGISKRIYGSNQSITRNVRNMASLTVDFLLGDIREHRYASEIVKATIGLVLRKCFNLLTPVAYRGYFITDESPSGGFVDSISTEELQLPDDVLSEIYPKIGPLATSTMFELISKSIKDRYNKPLPYEKYTDSLPHIVLMKAIRGYNREKDPMVKKRLLYIIKSALASGAIHSMPNHYFWNLFKFKDLSIIDLVMTELISLHFLYPRKGKSHPADDPLANPDNMLKGIFSFERTDILERYINLGVFKTIRKYIEYAFEATSNMLYSEARFIPDNYISFVESTELVDELRRPAYGDKRSIYQAIKSGSFSTKFHPDLLVDAINKGYVTAEHPIVDSNGIFEQSVVTRMSESVKGRHRDILGEYLPKESKYLRMPHLPPPVEYSTYEEFMSTLASDKTRNKVVTNRGYPNLVRLNNGNYVAPRSRLLLTFSKTPEGNFISRGVTTPKEMKEVLYKIDSLRIDGKIEVIMNTLKYLETYLNHDDISILYSILSKCVQITWDLLFGGVDIDFELGSTLYYYMLERPLLRALVTSYRDNKFNIPRLSL